MHVLTPQAGGPGGPGNGRGSGDGAGPVTGPPEDRPPVPRPVTGPPEDRPPVPRPVRSRRWVPLAAGGALLLVGGMTVGALLLTPRVTEQVQTGGPVEVGVPPPAEGAVPTLPDPTHQLTPVGEVGPGGEQAAEPLGDLCHPSELETTVTTPVPGGHDVHAVITSANTGERDCRVEGFPSIRLLSGGDDLALFVHVAQVDPTSGEHVTLDPVWLEPGERAETQVWWPSWGAAADLESDQQLQLGVGGGQELLDLGPDQRWDVVRSAEAYVSPWQRSEDER